MLRTRYIKTEAEPSLKGSVLTFFDLETNGLELTTPILEIAGLRIGYDDLMRGLETAVEFHSLIRFTGRISESAYAVHKIDSVMLCEKGRDFLSVLKDFSAFAQGTILVGHNIIQFDLPILSHHCTQMGILLKSKGVLDTCIMARERLQLPSYRLSVIAEYFKVKRRPTHRSLDDVRATAEIFAHIMRDGEKGCG
ncbi:3'-5' exonuclease [Candidatus Uhrbacteria bacterium]|nr:3'-5' exonuclease [Candidatus Uhrbacteria bacterium]